MRTIERQVIETLRRALSRPAGEFIDQVDAMDGYVRAAQDLAVLRRELQADFQIEIPAADAARWRYLGNMVDYVVSRVDQRAA